MTMKYAPQCEGRYALVGTLYSLLLVDLVNKEQVVLDKQYDGYYGFDVNDEYIYVGVRHNIPSRLVPNQYSNGEIIVYDFNFNYIKTIKPDFPLHQIHEILWYKNKLYVTNTGYDMVAIYDGNSWEEWYPLGKPDDQKTDSHHFNTLTIHDGKLYIGAHSFGPSTVFVFSLSTKEKINEIQIGNCAHNVWFDNDILHVCSSHEGLIASENGFIRSIAEWPRGIALCNNTTIIGSSALGWNAKSFGPHNAHIYAFDSQWKQKGLLFLDGESQIFDIFPIEQCLDPAKFFDDPRFIKQKILGISTTSEITKNEEVLLALYGASCLRSGRLTMHLQESARENARENATFARRLEKIEQRTFTGRLDKLKRSIRKRLHFFGISTR